MLDVLFLLEPHPTSPVLLPRRRQKGFSGERQLFSKLTEWEEPLSPPTPSPLSSRYALTSLTPTFFPSQFPPLSLWLAGLFSLLSNKRDKGGRVTFPPPPPSPQLSHPAKRSGVQACRPTLFKNAKRKRSKKCRRAKFSDAQEWWGGERKTP